MTMAEIPCAAPSGNLPNEQMSSQFDLNVSHRHRKLAPPTTWDVTYNLATTKERKGTMVKKIASVRLSVTLLLRCLYSLPVNPLTPTLVLHTLRCLHSL